MYILDALSKYDIIFQCYFWPVVHIFDAPKMTLNYSSIFPQRVANVQNASLKYATIFQCYIWTRHANFWLVENNIYDPSARIIKNPLNSTIFWTRHLNYATRQLNSATRQKCNYDPNGLPYCFSVIDTLCETFRQTTHQKIKTQKVKT